MPCSPARKILWHILDVGLWPRWFALLAKYQVTPILKTRQGEFVYFSAMKTDIHSSFAIAQSAAQQMDPMYAPSAIDSFSTMPHPAWEQCWTADQLDLLGLSEVVDSNAQHEYDIEDFVLNCRYTPALTNLTGSIFSQEHPTPAPRSELISPGKPSSNFEGPPCSLSTQSEKQKRKLNYIDYAPAKSSRHDSTEKAKTQAVEEFCENTKQQGSTNESTATNLSSLHFENSTDTRTLQERNRAASNKFRIKKKDDERKLKSAKKDMEQLNHNLSTCVKDLTLQVYNLKMKLFQHTNCGCVLIQKYIANEAQRYAQDLGDGE